MTWWRKASQRAFRYKNAWIFTNSLNTCTQRSFLSNFQFALTFAFVITCWQSNRKQTSLFLSSTILKLPCTRSKNFGAFKDIIWHQLRNQKSNQNTTWPNQKFSEVDVNMGLKLHKGWRFWLLSTTFFNSVVVFQVCSIQTYCLINFSKVFHFDDRWIPKNSRNKKQRILSKEMRHHRFHLCVGVA